MRTFIIFLAGLVICSSNAESTEPVENSSVYEWAETLVAELQSIYPKSFYDIAIDTELQDGFEYTGPIPQKEPETIISFSLNAEEGRFIRNVGVVSAIAESCDLDWAYRNFLPMMQWQRKITPPSEAYGSQIAIIGALHEFSQGGTTNWVKENNPRCKKAKKILKNNLFADKFEP